MHTIVTRQPIALRTLGIVHALLLLLLAACHVVEASPPKCSVCVERDGELFVVQSRVYKVAVDKRGGLIDRKRYRIRLDLSTLPPTTGYVELASGDTIAIGWNEGRIDSLTGAGVDLFETALVVADDLSRGQVRIGNSTLDVKQLDTRPPLRWIKAGNTDYLYRVGLARTWWPDTTLRWCILKQCAVTIEGPAGVGDLRIEDNAIVELPAVVTQERRAWREIVPSRVQRMRADLIESERALADARAATGEVAEEAARRSLAQLRDAADALDDIIDALPSTRISRLRYEALRDELREELVKVELAAVDAQRFGELPAIAALRLELSTIVP